MDTLRKRLIRLASEHPEFRDQLLPILKEAARTTAETAPIWKQLREDAQDLTGFQSQLIDAVDGRNTSQLRDVVRRLLVLVESMKTKARDTQVFPNVD